MNPFSKLVSNITERIKSREGAKNGPLENSGFAKSRPLQLTVTDKDHLPLPEAQKKKRPSYRIRRQREFRTDFQQEDFRFAIAHAEDPENPRRSDLYEFYKEAMRDLHLKSQVRTAIFIVKSEPWVLRHRETKEVDETLSLLLRKKWFDDLLKYHLEAEFWGHSLMEFQALHPSDDGWVFKEVKLIPREHVRPETGELLVSPNDEKGLPYRDPKFSTWFIESGDPYDLGLLCICAKHSLYKKYTFGDWARSNEKWGDPVLVIRSASDDDAENDKKEEFAAGFGNNGYAIFDKEDEVELLDRKNGDKAYERFLEFIKLNNEENSKGINGQVGTADEKSFVGAAKVQERILNEYSEDRLRGLYYFVNDIVLPYLYNLLDGQTAYKVLEGYEWIPLRFIPETERPGYVPTKENDGGIDGGDGEANGQSVEGGNGKKNQAPRPGQRVRVRIS